MTNTRSPLARWVGLLSLLASTALQAAPEAGPGAPGSRIQGPRASGAEDPQIARVIVKYRADSLMRRVQSANAGEGVSAAGAAGATPQPRHAGRLSGLIRVPLQDGRVLGPHIQALRGSGLSSGELVRRLRAHPDVEWAVVDERRRAFNIPNDPFYSDKQTTITPVVGQWYLRAPAGEVRSAINVEGAWALTTGSPTITVAVLDTGIRSEHPDLQGKLHPGYDFVGLDQGGATTTANDGNGRDADPTDPGDWSAAGECSAGEPASSSSWHGTQTASLIGAATNNGIGMAGVGWQTKVLPVRVLGRCGGYDSDILAGMRWAAGVTQDVGTNTVVNVPNANPARILNMSLGSQGSCSTAYSEVFRELTTAGVAIVVAAGNDTGFKVSAPANCPGAISVSGVRHIGTKVGYSNIGPEVTLAAPAGNCVNLQGLCLYPLLTAINLGLRQPTTSGYSDSSDFTVGTSFAAPLVAGTVALMMAIDPSLTPTKVKEILQATARSFPSSGSGSDVTACRAPDTTEQLECYCTATTCGAGMLDATAAVARALALKPATPVEPPPAPTPIGGGGSGGGSSGLGWLAGLLLGVAALGWIDRRRLGRAFDRRRA